MKKNKIGNFSYQEDKNFNKEILGQYNLCKSIIFDKTFQGHKILQKIYSRINNSDISSSDWDNWDNWDND